MSRSRIERLAEALELEAQAFELLAKAKRMQAAETRAPVAESASVDELVGLREASRRFGLSVRQLREAIKGGKLPDRRRGKRGYLVSSAEVMKLVEVNRVQPCAEPPSAAEARANINRLLEAGKLRVLKRE